MIRLDKVAKVYRQDRQEVTALKEISLAIAKGKFVAIMGPSGSGKSTLLNLIGGLDQPTSGTVTVDGIDHLTRKAPLPDALCQVLDQPNAPII